MRGANEAAVKVAVAELELLYCLAQCAISWPNMANLRAGVDPELVVLPLRAMYGMRNNVSRRAQCRA